MLSSNKKPQDKSTTFGFLFYFLALLGWSIYDFFITGTTGWQVPILFLGFAIYLWSKVFYQQRKIKETVKESELKLK
ncbi:MULTISPECIES: hypothetical protein [Planococcus]|uniref:hypothetical protein n=1 Tax=Planococcus TaxID=1372 RepID=UPI0007932714|nr:hypothetical protein [Planococcus maritimus]KYG60041.1 hypothetical protein AY633_07360 [Planococcus maritimus]